MNIYALLIGINDYPVKPLYQCVNDAAKMEAYLKGLPDEVTVITKKILNADATKEAIAAGITNFLGKAGDDDVALMYYSGHGAQEDGAGRFKDEHDGMLECIVSCPDPGQTSGYLVADKELRYLFSQLPNSPHLVTVFDCCHSGDIVRSLVTDKGIAEQTKRLVNTFPPRKYAEFLFSDAVSVMELEGGVLADLIPYKNGVHISACSAKELSWEDRQGGIFTRYLLQLLKASENRISYQEIARWANISLKEVTSKKQSPSISVQGAGDVSNYSPWLNINKEGAKREEAFVVHNAAKGWYLNVGALLGMKAGESVTIDPEGKALKMKIAEADIDSSLIHDPQNKLGIELDQRKKYPVLLNTTQAELRLYVNNLDGLKGDTELLEKLGTSSQGASLGTIGSSDYFLNVFNEFVYLSLYNDPFRPLAEQISLLDKAEKIEDAIRMQLQYLAKWHHFDTLENADYSFDVSPISVEIQVDGEQEWQDVTNRDFIIEPATGRIGKSKVINQKMRARVTNITASPIFVGVLNMGSDLSISSKMWNDKVAELGPGETKYFYDHKQKGDAIRLFMDPYKEIYNWKDEWFHLKFIVNDYENFTTSLPDYYQPALDAPLTIEDMLMKGSMSDEDYDADHGAIVRRWGTLKTTLRLRNPEYNIIGGELARNWEEYEESEELAPFISRLYLKNEVNGLVTKTKELPNLRTGEEELSRGVFGRLTVGLANFLENKGRKRKFERARSAMIDKPVIVAEGDSWFLYPFLVKDVIDYVMEEYPVLSIASAGDELGNYKETGRLLHAVAEYRPEFVLISGGGNDIIGPEIENLLHENVPPGREAREYLNGKFDENINKLRKLYEFFISELKGHHSVRQLFLHGYDYIRIDHDDATVQKGWVNRYLLAKGVQEAEDRDRVIRFLIDSFNEMLIKLSANDPFVTFIDVRGKVEQGQWYDEIHPDDVGYGTVGKLFIEKLNEFASPQIGPVPS